MLNTLYYIPMQFVGLVVWRKHINEETGEVEKRKMRPQGLVLLIAVIAVVTYLYGLLLGYLRDAMPFVDAFTTISSVVAMIISIRMYAEQWWIWVVVDVFSVYMWWCDFRSGSDNMATLLMWGVYLGNAIIMLVKWEKEARKKNAV